MSGISPLQDIHKKGLFGDHYKKKESDLLQISDCKIHWSAPYSTSTAGHSHLIQFSNDIFWCTNANSCSLSYQTITKTTTTPESSRVLML